MFKFGIKKALITLTIALSGLLMLAPGLVNADPPNPCPGTSNGTSCSSGSSGATANLKAGACDGVNSLSGTGGGTTCSADAQSSLDKILRMIIQIFTVLVGFVAVLMIVVGGLRLMTANGDSSAIASARSAITYALVGLMVVALAQVLVHFVLFKTVKAAG